MQASHLTLATFFCQHDKRGKLRAKPHSTDKTIQEGGGFRSPKALKSHLAETPPSVWVAHFRSDAITVAVTGYTLGKAVVPRSAAITLPAPNPRLATTEIQSQTQPVRRQVQLCTLTSTTDVSVVRCHSPALSSEAVTVGPGDIFDSSGRAFAAVAAQQGMIAKRLSLAHVAGRFHRLRGADAFSRHLVAQAAAALARCARKRGGIWRKGLQPRRWRSTRAERCSRLQ